MTSVEILFFDIFYLTQEDWQVFRLPLGDAFEKFRVQEGVGDSDAGIRRRDPSAHGQYVGIVYGAAVVRAEGIFAKRSIDVRILVCNDAHAHACAAYQDAAFKFTAADAGR